MCPRTSAVAVIMRRSLGKAGHPPVAATLCRHEYAPTPYRADCSSSGRNLREHYNLDKADHKGYGLPMKMTEPGKWYFVVDCAGCGEAIPFLEAPSPEDK